MPTLIAFAGLPGTGKTTVARELAKQLGAVYLRIDTIEQALSSSSAFTGEMQDAGYRAAYAVAEENLRQGLDVVADSVNPLNLTRDAWIAVATRANATLLEVELICTDQAQHRLRIETRQADIPGHKLPTWSEVVTREYEPWDRDRRIFDTASRDANQVVELIRHELVQQS